MTIDDSIEMFGKITWCVLIHEVRSERFEEHEREERLADDYGIEIADLDKEISAYAQNKYYDRISYHLDNITGPGTDAFNLIRSMDLVPLDVDGNGGAYGVTLVQSTADGPRKYTYIDDDAAAQWLALQFLAQNLDITIVNV